MHACGHDCHIAMMLGTLQILRHMTDDIHGEVRIVFQPSEENGQGAKLMIGTGVLDASMAPTPRTSGARLTPAP